MEAKNSFQKVLKIIQEHFNYHDNFNLDDYLHCFGKESFALLYSTLFCPELIEIDSCVILKRNLFNEEELKSRLAKADKNNLSKIESEYNFIEIGYIFDGQNRDLSEDEDEILAYRIRDCWEGWLKTNYPDRKFIVQVIGPEETGSTVGVCFFEDRE